MGIKILYPESKELFLHALRDQRVAFYLQQLKNFSRETYTHSIRVGLFSDLGHDFRLDPSLLISLGYALMLHDVGKLLIPEEILHKRERLTGEERATIRLHPRNSFLLLRDFDPTVRKAVIAHHEYQKDPYPRKGQDQRKIARGFERRVPCPHVSSLAQMIAVADKYDALAWRRSYKRDFSSKEVVDLLNEEFRGEGVYLESLLRRVF